MLRACLSRIPARAPDCIQFGSADWFWERWANTYVLQVEPARHKEKDEVILDAAEARQVQTVRDQFFMDLKTMLSRHVGNC